MAREGWTRYGSSKTNNRHRSGSPYESSGTESLRVSSLNLDIWIVPKWGNYSLSDVLKQLANGTRAKLRNIMSAIFAHAMRWEFFDRNPITLVRQSTKRQREPEVLTVEELKALFEELEGIYRTMVFVGGVVGLRVSEVIGLRWSDCDFESGEIHLSRGIVRQHETEMKTEASRKPVPMEQGLAEVLTGWRAECAYNQPDDYVFASIKMHGKQPIWPNSAMEDHIRPAAKRAGITKRISWHTLRHTLVRCSKRTVKMWRRCKH